MSEQFDLYVTDSPNQLTNLIDALYEIGNSLYSEEHPHIINCGHEQKCALVLKDKKGAYVVNVDGAWPLACAYKEDTVVIQLDLTKCKIRRVEKKE